MSDAFEVIPPAIKTGRLNMRRLTVEDTPAIYAYASDAEVARFTLWPPHKSEEFTKRFLGFFTQPIFLSWAITLPESVEAIGMVFLHSLSKQHKKAEIAFNLARAYWKKGLTTEATGSALDFAFQQLCLNRVEATCMPANLGARRVLERAGMSHEGTMRRSHVRYDGAHDMDLFAMLRDDKRTGDAVGAGST